MGAMEWRETRVSLIAALALCAGGLVFGTLIGSAVSSRSNQPGASQNTALSGTHSSDSVEASKLVLGNIATVPFQELYTVLSARSPAELAEVAQQLKSLPAGHEKEQKIAKFFKAWAHFDANAALRAATALDTPAARRKAIGAVVEGADATAAESLANAINELPPDALSARWQRGLLYQAATKWSEIDAPAAAAFVDTLPSVPDVFADVHTIAGNWASSDPQAALAWAQQHDSGPGFSSHFAASGAINGWWQKDPAAAEAYVASHLTTQADRQLASSLASSIFESDPKHALEWVNSLPDVDARRQADSILVHQLGWTDPKAAVEWAASLPQDVRLSVFNSAVSAWAQNNPAAAAEWLGALNGPLRD